MALELDNTNHHLYMRVYQYYKNLILSGKLRAGTKMPSLRRCAQQLQISRTTVEAAYLLLAADAISYLEPKAVIILRTLPPKHLSIHRPKRKQRLLSAMISLPQAWTGKAFILMFGDGISKALSARMNAF